MKILKYKIMTEFDIGTEAEPNVQQILSDVSLGWSAENEAVAQREAYQGKYTVEDDGEPEPEPTAQERIEELEALVAELLFGGESE